MSTSPQVGIIMGSQSDWPCMKSASIILKELKKNWINSRSSFSKLIVELDQKNLSEKAIFRHGLMGRINLSLTLYFFKIHFNHHLKQINKRLNTNVI